MPNDPGPLPEFMDWEDVPSLVGSTRTRSIVARPTAVEQVRRTLAFAREQGLTVCPRGSGRSYADMALNDGNVLLDMSRMNRILEIDREAKQIKVEGGTRLIEIYEAVHHELLTLPAVPTESHSSVAGAIVANVNGKDAWRRGNFGEQVVRLSLMTADGELHELDREHELFGAVVGGMGLLGVVIDATLQLRSIPSPYVEIDRIPVPNVDALLAKMAEVEKTCDAIVVWVDAYAKGEDIGRSVIHTATWIEQEQTAEERKEAIEAGIARLGSHRRLGLALHAMFGPGLTLMLQAQRPALRWLNRLYYAGGRMLVKTDRARNTELFLRFNFEASFTVPPAYLVCGPRGYTVQITFPRSSAREALAELLTICQDSPCPPVTTILRAHRADDHLISFSEDGYSLNFEIHPKKRHVQASRSMVDRLIDAVARRGGKVHLAKDHVLTAEQFRRVYPGNEELRRLKERLDPEGLFASDLARRIGMTPVE